MKILLLGKNGQLGWDLQWDLVSLGTLYTPDRSQLDLTNKNDIYSYITDVNPNVIVNAAAYTNVDKAETEPDMAFLVNAEAAGWIADAAAKCQAALIHFSTDYVFDGGKTNPYRESDEANPINVYGKSKLAGEGKIRENSAAYIILRTSWLYSWHHNCYLTKILKLARSAQNLQIVTDQTGSPTSRRLLAEITGQLIALSLPEPFRFFNENHGIYHLAGDGAVNRFRFTEAILAKDPNKDKHICNAIQPVDSSFFPQRAKRPSFSALNCDLFTQKFHLRLPPWEVGLHLTMNELGFQNG